MTIILLRTLNDKLNIKKEMDFIKLIKYNIFNYPEFDPKGLPKNVNEFIVLFGEPYHIQFPSIDDLSPQGQWFFFENKEESLKVKILGDHYRQVPNYNASVRYLVIESLGATIEIFQKIFLFKTQKKILKV